MPRTRSSSSARRPSALWTVCCMDSQCGVYNLASLKCETLPAPQDDISNQCSETSGPQTMCCMDLRCGMYNLL